MNYLRTQMHIMKQCLKDGNDKHKINKHSYLCKKEEGLKFGRNTWRLNISILCKLCDVNVCIYFIFLYILYNTLLGI